MKIRLFSKVVRLGRAARVKFCLNLHDSLFTILLFWLIHGTEKGIAQGPNLDFPEMDIYEQFLGNWSTSKTDDPNYDSWAKVNRTYRVFKDMMKAAGRRKRKLEEKKRWKRYEPGQVDRSILEMIRKQNQYEDEKKREDKPPVGGSLDNNSRIVISMLFAFTIGICRLAWKYCRNADESPPAPPVTEGGTDSMQPLPDVESTPFVPNSIRIINRTPSPSNRPLMEESRPSGLSPVRNHERPSGPPSALLNVDDGRQEDLPPSYEEVPTSPAKNQKISGPSW